MFKNEGKFEEHKLMEKQNISNQKNPELKISPTKIFLIKTIFQNKFF